MGTGSTSFENKGKDRIILGVITTCLLTIGALCAKLFDMQYKNTQKINEKNNKVIDLVKNVINDLDPITRNTKLPEDIRNKAIDTKIRLQKKIDKYLSKDNKEIIADVKVNNHDIRIMFSEEEYLRNKSFYDKALHKFDSQYKQIVSKLKQMIMNDKRKDIRCEMAKANDSIWEFDSLYKEDSNTLLLLGGLENQYITDYYINLYVYYDKSGKFEYDYSGLR